MYEKLFSFLGSVLCDMTTPIPIVTKFKARVVIFNIDTPITQGTPVCIKPCHVACHISSHAMYHAMYQTMSCIKPCHVSCHVSCHISSHAMFQALPCIKLHLGCTILPRSIGAGSLFGGGPFTRPV